MDKLKLNKLLNRMECENKFIESLKYFELHKKELLTKRGIYVYGAPGSGKTLFVKKILKKLNYDIVLYDAGDVRNKTVIETITKHNMSDSNVLSLLRKKEKKIAIIMDEIDGMNNGDKGGINSLIKLIRPKKTNKQKKEDITMMPIICIGNYHVDKKIKEMMKICTTIELKNPTKSQIKKIIKKIIKDSKEEFIEKIVNYVQGDLRKLKSVYDICNNHKDLLKNNIIHKIFEKKNYNEDTKDITKKLLNNYYSIEQHNVLMNETDRTSIGLLFHENVIEVLKTIKKEKAIKDYIKFLSNIVFSDYIDRITFQKQIWIFNEMTSLIKTFYNNRILHKEILKDKKDEINYDGEIRFTKVLTKYSTEYNNIIFIQNLCNKLMMDKKDLFSFFVYLKEKYPIEEIIEMLLSENYEISKLDIARLYRYLNKYYN